jgi:hypothetical protein
VYLLCKDAAHLNQSTQKPHDLADFLGNVALAASPTTAEGNRSGDVEWQIVTTKVS